MTDDKSYTSNAKARYRDLFIDLMARSHRAGQMMYKDAAAAEKRLHWFTLLVPKGFTFTGATSVGVTMLKKFEGTKYLKSLRIGGFSFVALGTAMEYAVLHSDTLKDYLSRKADIYIKAASGWQKIMQTASAYLIFIDNPQVQITEIEKKYLELVKERAEITKNVIVSKETYEAITDKKTIQELCARNALVQDLKKKIDFSVWPGSDSEA